MKERKIEPLGVHVFMHGLLFPVAAYAYNEKEQGTVRFMEMNFPYTSFTTEDVCRWCITHNIQYKIVTDMVKWTIWKRIEYWRILQKLKKWEKAKALDE